MTKELLKATLPGYLAVNVVLLLLLLTAFVMGIQGAESFVIANVAAAFVSVQIVVAAAGIYYLKDDEDEPDEAPLEREAERRRFR